ncbi:hypothetical protein [Elizabethkingia anophelis]|uniref:hypothetical protein n=1 Tax=Elizabethkingia anophelis TaxID=1117645 RepID=UPI003891B41C
MKNKLSLKSWWSKMNNGLPEINPEQANKISEWGKQFESLAIKPPKLEDRVDKLKAPRLFIVSYMAKDNNRSIHTGTMGIMNEYNKYVNNKHFMDNFLKCYKRFNEVSILSIVELNRADFLEYFSEE